MGTNVLYREFVPMQIRSFSGTVRVWGSSRGRNLRPAFQTAVVGVPLPPFAGSEAISRCNTLFQNGFTTAKITITTIRAAGTSFQAR
jgi:hypothetical protein